jgi:hypothetical protein
MELKKPEKRSNYSMTHDSRNRTAAMIHPLYELLQKLDDARIHYTLSCQRPGSVLVSVTVVGQRVEIDVFSDGHMEVSRFIGHEDVEGGAELIDSIIGLG